MNLIKSSIIIATIIGVCACTPYTKVDKNGKALEELNFPKLSKVDVQNGVDGSFIDWTDFNMLRPGLSKYQVMQITGTPHYHEGFFEVREWDFVFNKWIGESQLEQCQLKVLFDDNKVSTSYHWRPLGCNNNFTVSADLLFDFDSAVLKGKGKLAIDQILAQNGKAKAININGFSDPIGDDQYNLKLSQQRANAVKNYIKTNGFNGTINAVGKGENTDKAKCGDTIKDIKCNHPNRRVEFNFK